MPLDWPERMRNVFNATAEQCTTADLDGPQPPSNMLGGGWETHQQVHSAEVAACQASVEAHIATDPTIEARRATAIRIAQQLRDELRTPGTPLYAHAERFDLLSAEYEEMGCFHFEEHGTNRRSLAMVCRNRRQQLEALRDQIQAIYRQRGLTTEDFVSLELWPLSVPR